MGSGENVISACRCSETSGMCHLQLCKHANVTQEARIEPAPFTEPPCPALPPSAHSSFTCLHADGAALPRRGKGEVAVDCGTADLLANHLTSSTHAGDAGLWGPHGLVKHAQALEQAPALLTWNTSKQTGRSSGKSFVWFLFHFELELKQTQVPHQDFHQELKNRNVNNELQGFGF